MSEVIDAQVVDTVATDVKTEDPLAGLLATPQRTEIVATEEADLSPEDKERVEQYMSQIDITDSQLV